MCLLLIIQIGHCQQENNPCELYEEARQVIFDYNRIVTPQGVDESFVAEIGGLKQYISVKGYDRNNPILLFIHGGPASPLSPVSVNKIQRRKLRSTICRKNLCPKRYYRSKEYGQH